jgi:hypothetical protein
MWAQIPFLKGEVQHMEYLIETKSKLTDQCSNSKPLL